MKTLIIHPSDLSTGFLEDVYSNKGYTELNVETSPKSEIKAAIKSHDRIIMLGHGTSHGLLSSQQDRFIINSELVYLLRQKILVGIWCNAIDFSERYKLNGLWSGMIISERSESTLLDKAVSDSDIFSSNLLFSEAIRGAESIDDEGAIDVFKHKYNAKCDVVEFNRERMFYISRYNQKVVI